MVSQQCTHEKEGSGGEEGVQLAETIWRPIPCFRIFCRNRCSVAEDLEMRIAVGDSRFSFFSRTRARASFRLALAQGLSYEKVNGRILSAIQMFDLFVCPLGQEGGISEKHEKPLKRKPLERSRERCLMTMLIP